MKHKNNADKRRTATGHQRRNAGMSWHKSEVDQDVWAFIDSEIPHDARIFAVAEARSRRDLDSLDRDTREKLEAHALRGVRARRRDDESARDDAGPYAAPRHARGRCSSFFWLLVGPRSGRRHGGSLWRLF